MGEGIKDRLGNGLSPISKLRFQISHGSIIAYSALALILFVAFVIRILPLRWENLSAGTSLLNEFDPFYQFSITQHMVNYGLLSPYWPTHWIDTLKWYPAGLDMSTALPSLPMTAAVLYQIVSVFGKVDLMTFCAILPALIGAVSCLVLYFIGKDMGGRTVGLLSALFLALSPSFLQRSALGFFDTEVPGVLGLVLFIFLFLRSMDNKRSLRSSLVYALSAGAALAYFISGWGAAYFMVDLTVLFVFVMVLMRRYSQRLLISYSVTFGLALFIATKVPYISLNYLISGAIIPVAAGFVLLLIAEVLRNNISLRTKLTMAAASIVVAVGGFSALWLTGYISSSGLQGKFSTVLNPFIRATSPLISSVAEQRISGWGNLYIELGISILFFLVGLYFTLKNPTNRNVFLLLFTITSLYFATSMVRLLVLFAPAFAIVASLGVIGLMKPFNALLQESPRAIAKSKRRLSRVSKEYSGVALFLIFIILASNLAFSPQVGGMPRAVSQAFVPTAISAASLPVGGASLTQPVRAWLDATDWMRNNLPSATAVVSWWDYGNWISDIGNVTSLDDNTTTNSTQIENVGFIMMGNENQSMLMLNSYGQDRTQYILVFTVLQISQSSTTGAYLASPAGYGDEGKWSWMARISGEAKNRLSQGTNPFMTASTSWTDETSFGAADPQSGKWVWNDKGQNCTVYELMNYAEVQYCNAASAAYGITITPDATTTTPTYFTQADFAGLNVSPGEYGGLVPIVAIYKIDWAAYDAAMRITP